MEDNLHRNFSSDPPYPDFTQLAGVRALYVAAFLLVMSLSVVGNAIVCLTVATHRQMHTAVNYYIVNLAACDLMVGCFVLPVKLVELAAPAGWAALNGPLCTALMYLQTVVVFASVLTLVAVCIERYMAVLHPLESRMHQTKARAKRILLAVWLAPFLVATPFLYPAEAFANELRSPYGIISRLTCFVRLPEDVRKGYYTFLFVAIYCLPLVFIGGTCVQVARCLLRDIPVNRQGSVRRQEANRRKVAKMVLMVVAAFSVCWTPYFLVSLVTQYQAVNFLERGQFFFTMLNINLLAFANSCVNPCIYAAMSTRFRNGFVRCLGCVSCCRDAEVATDRTTAIKRVRFRCQPACLILQSSSDGSNEAIQRTLSTAEHPRGGGRSLFFFGRKRTDSIIAQYIKKEGMVHFSDSRPQEEVNYALENKLNALAEMQSAPPKKSRPGSTGDLHSLTKKPTRRHLSNGRKWSSCLNVSSQQRERTAF